MKYTLLNAETEEKIFEFENAADETIFSGNMYSAKNSCGKREVLFASRSAKSGQVQIASALGSMNFILARGALAEDAAGANKGSKSLKSSMPGKVLRVICKEGDSVTQGDSLLVIEAMKMENEIRAPITGVIEKIMVRTEQKVETGELLLVLKN